MKPEEILWLKLEQWASNLRDIAQALEDGKIDSAVAAFMVRGVANNIDGGEE